MPTERARRDALSRTLAVCCVAFLSASRVTTAQPGEEPLRIASINVCTDQLLVTLVERERIVSLSHLAADPYSSWIGADAEGLRLNRGTAEEVIALEPDLIVTATFSFQPTVAILERLGYPVLELPMATSLEAIASNIRVLADAVGEVERGSALIETFRSEVDRHTFHGNGPRPLFMSYEADGWTTGRDSLVADIARTAGFETVGDRLGLSGGRRVSVEDLLILQPELLDLGHPWDEPPALVSESLSHPALRALLARTAQVDVPDPLWLCGSTRTVEALALLRRARDRVEAK